MNGIQANDKVLFLFAWIGILLLTAQMANGQFYDHKYAVVIGINDYPHANWPNLDYARGDAQAVANMLNKKGYKVYSLYDQQATRKGIISLMEDKLAPYLKDNDAVLVFFAGHGTTRERGNEDWGYIVPSDGTSQSSTYIDMEELRKLSRKMGKAKHQVFIMDSCYGGSLGTRAGAIPDNIPNYLDAVSSRTARQILTAGGKDQEVADGGPDGHSVFTGYFLKGIEEGKADTNYDGWITFSELANYVTYAASSSIQTPGFATLPRHEQGEFLFESARTQVDDTTADAARNANDNVGGGRRSGAEPIPPARRLILTTIL